MFIESPNLLLIKSISAVYLSRKVGMANGRCESIIREVVGNVKLPTDIDGEGSVGEIARALSTTLEYILSLPEEIVLVKKDLLERIRVNCSFASDMVDSLSRSLDTEGESDNEIADRVRGILSELQYQLRLQKIAKLFREGNQKVNFNKDAASFKLNEFMSLFGTQLRDLSSVGEEKIPGLAGELSTADADGLVTCFENTVELNSDTGLLKMGLQGLNKMFNGGCRRGGSYLAGALSHHYKSGLLLKATEWLPMLNKPLMTDPNRTPVIVRFSFENRLEQDLPMIYRSIWEQEHQQKLDVKEINAREATEYVINRLGKNGYRVEIKCIDPNNFDCWDLIDVLNNYELNGFEVHAIIIDYPELITKKTSRLSGMRKDEHIAYTFEVIRNHCFPRGILMWSAHQLSMDALKIYREGSSNFAKKMAGGSYYHLCNSLSQKVDTEVILAKHMVGEDTYLTMARGKDRFGNETPESHRFCAYLFEQYGGICTDLDGESKAVYSWAAISQQGGGDTTDSAVGSYSSSDDDW